MPKLIIRNITKIFDNKEAIKNINLELHEGELVCILGVSGVGKTTLFDIIAGLVPPDEGEIILDGVDITGKTGYISYMFQKDLLLSYKTIEDNIALPLIIKGKNKKEARAIVLSHLSQFGLQGTEKKYPYQLSGGMRQRAALLRTYLFSQDMALLDEPFSALDMITKRSMHKWYLDIMNKIKLSTLFITHDIDEAITLSDRIYIMTGQPGTLSHQIIINEKKPREIDFNLTRNFLDYKKEIIDKLQKS